MHCYIGKVYVDVRDGSNFQQNIQNKPREKESDYEVSKIERCVIVVLAIENF